MLPQPTKQKLQQESTYCKMKINNWKAKLRERQKTIAENFNFTTPTSKLVREPSASTISNNDITDYRNSKSLHYKDSKSPRMTGQTSTNDRSTHHTVGLLYKESKSPRMTSERENHGGITERRKKEKSENRFPKLFLKSRAVTTLH